MRFYYKNGKIDSNECAKLFVIVFFHRITVVSFRTINVWKIDRHEVQFAIWRALTHSHASGCLEVQLLSLISSPDRGWATICVVVENDAECVSLHYNHSLHMNQFLTFNLFVVSSFVIQQGKESTTYALASEGVASLNLAQVLCSQKAIASLTTCWYWAAANFTIYFSCQILITILRNRILYLSSIDSLLKCLLGLDHTVP